MTPTEILNLGAVGILFFLFMREFFSYLKEKKGGNRNEKYEKVLENCQKSLEEYKDTVKEINHKLGNHLTEVNGKIGGIERELADVQRSLAIIGESVNDIKINLK